MLRDEKQQWKTGLDGLEDIQENSRRTGKDADVIIQGPETLGSNDTKFLHCHLKLIKKQMSELMMLKEEKKKVQFGVFFREA